MIRLKFGLFSEVPPEKEVAWGARWIFPADMVFDRQDFIGIHTPEGQRLQKWLNSGGALRKAKAKAEKLHQQYRLSHDDCETIVLHEDHLGKLVGNPRRSFGYLYVAAWLKETKLREEACPQEDMKPSD